VIAWLRVKSRAGWVDEDDRRAVAVGQRMPTDIIMKQLISP